MLKQAVRAVPTIVEIRGVQGHYTPEKHSQAIADSTKVLVLDIPFSSCNQLVNVENIGICLRSLCLIFDCMGSVLLGAVCCSRFIQFFHAGYDCDQIERRFRYTIGSSTEHHYGNTAGLLDCCVTRLAF